MKNTISLVFAIIILVQSFTRTWIILSFKVNQDYIAKVLCINRNKPQMHCDGKCILMLKMKADEENEQKKMPQLLKNQIDFSYCIQVLSSDLAVNRKPGIKQNIIIGQQELQTSSFVKGIFRPPQHLALKNIG